MDGQLDQVLRQRKETASACQELSLHLSSLLRGVQATFVRGGLFRYAGVQHVAVEHQIDESGSPSSP